MVAVSAIPLFHFSTIPLIACTACESCHFPPSMIMRSGQLSSPRRAQRDRLVSISSIDAKSSIIPILSVFIRYFLYLFGSGFPFTRTDLLATVCSQWLCDMSKHSKIISFFFSSFFVSNRSLFISSIIVFFERVAFLNPDISS